MNEIRQRGGLAETFLQQKSCIRKSCETKAVKQRQQKKEALERHFSTSDEMDAGEGWGGGSDWHVSASLTPWMASIFTDFIPCKAFKRVKERAQKKRDHWVRKRSRLLAEETKVALSC